MPALPLPLTRLLGATLPDGGRVDVELTGATVSAVAPASPQSVSPAENELDLAEVIRQRRDQGY